MIKKVIKKIVKKIKIEMMLLIFSGPLDAYTKYKEKLEKEIE